MDTGFFFPVKPQPLLTQHQRWRKVAELTGLSPGARMRLEWIIFYETVGRRDATKTAAHFGIARKTFHQWRGRFAETNLTTLEERSRAPHRLRQKCYTPEQVDRVRRLRKRYPTAGRDKLAIFYVERYGEELSDHFLKNIISEHNLYAERATRKPKPATSPPKLRLPTLLTDPDYRPGPGVLVEVDGIEERVDGQRVYILTAICYHSRLALAYAYRSKAAVNAADFLRRLSLLFGKRIRYVHVDNGSEFKGAFLGAVEALGPALYHARPYTPEDKPLVERFNGNLEQECLYLGNLTADLSTLNATIFDYLLYYNFERPHHGIGLKRPMEVASIDLPTETEVLPMCPPRTGS